MSWRNVHVGLAVAAMLGLVGCAASSVGPVFTLPSGLPSNVPILEGRVVATAASLHEWKVWIASGEPGVAYKKVAEQLQKAGFSAVSSEAYVDNGQGQFCDQQYCVNVDAYDDPDYGKSVAYDVFPLTPNAVS